MIKVTAVSRKIGTRVRNLREHKRLTQETLALEAGLNRAYIGYIERGERNPSTETLVKVAKALRIPVHELLK